MNGFQKLIKVFAVCLAVFIILAIINGILWLVYSIGFDNKTIDFKEKYENVTEITLDLSVTSINIISGDEFKVDATDVPESFEAKILGNTLKIKEKSSWFGNNNFKGEVTITIPSNKILNKLDIDAGAGEINIDGVNVSSFDLDQGAGVIKINNVNFEKTNIDGGAGEMIISNATLNDLKIDAGVGKISINGKITGNSKIDCGVGEVDLNLTGGEELYSIYAEKGLGDIKIKNMSYTNNASFGSGSEKIRIEGGVGSINIDFIL